MYTGYYLLNRRYDWGCGVKSLHWILNRHSSLLCGCYYPVKSSVCSLVVGVGAPRCFGAIFLCSVRSCSTPTGIESPEYFSTGAVHLWVCSVVSIFTHCTCSDQLLLLFSFFFFFFPFILPTYVEISHVLSSVWVLLPMFSRCPVKIGPFIDIFLMYMWEEVSSIYSYSTILISSKATLVKLQLHRSFEYLKLSGALLRDLWFVIMPSVRRTLHNLLYP